MIDAADGPHQPRPRPATGSPRPAATPPPSRSSPSPRASVPRPPRPRCTPAVPSSARTTPRSWPTRPPPSSSLPVRRRRDGTSSAGSSRTRSASSPTSSPAGRAWTAARWSPRSPNGRQAPGSWCRSTPRARRRRRAVLPVDVGRLVDEGRGAGLDVAGLMTIGVDGDERATAMAFEQVAAIGRRARVAAAVDGHVGRSRAGRGGRHHHGPDRQRAVRSSTHEGVGVSPPGPDPDHVFAPARPRHSGAAVRD